MEPKRPSYFVPLILGVTWLLILAWQIQEHERVVGALKSGVQTRAHEIASTLGAVTRAIRFRVAVSQDRLEPLLKELVGERTNELSKPSDILAVGLLNTDGDPIVAVGKTNLLSREILAESERWSENYVTFVLPVEGATVSPEGVTNNPTVVLPRFRDLTNNAEHGASDATLPTTNGEFAKPPPDEAGHHPPGGGDPHGGRRPPWMRGWSDVDFKALTAKRELHGLVLAISTEMVRGVSAHDLWLRGVIVFFAGISALGAAFAWRSISKNADLQIRLVRASEQNSHLKELNLAAAGLAHETRNPLNLIRGQAQMLSRLPDATNEIRAQSKVIVDQTDKVTAQLTEFINYSRPREVRRTKIILTRAAAEVVRTLDFDIAEKKLHVEVTGEALTIEADEQLLRQVLFNLLLNAIQAVSENGKIEIAVQRAGLAEAVLEVRDDGPGVPAANRQEIFKPYFTTRPTGTGLGLAVVSQNVLAHGWTIDCLANEPRGAIFRLTHLKLAA